MEPRLTWYWEPSCRPPCKIDTSKGYNAGSGHIRIRCSYRPGNSKQYGRFPWNLLLVENIDEEHRETSAQNFLRLAEMKLAQYLAENGIEADTP